MSPGSQGPRNHDDDGEQILGQATRDASASTLASMFEEFLNRQNQRGLGQRELILLGEPSPLTFALEEFAQNLTSSNLPRLHDASPHIRKNDNLTVIQKGVHPPHVERADLAYLYAKGAFSLPPDETLNDLIEAYMERFHASYSILDKAELEKVHEDRKVPWILLHSLCFVGATFCDVSVIYRAGFKTRLEARRDYYEKAKVLFDMGYEKSKIILIQCAIMLSFRGPQMDSYWNPCSWIEFGVTLAVSLGIHRSMASSNARHADKGQLRRLWWTLVVRDTYCSVLLGRPFRINLNQCDTGQLTMDDFSCERPKGAFYQVEVAKLCLILRDIMHYRFGPGNPGVTPESIRTQLENWLSNARKYLEQWNARGIPSSSLCSTALDILFNYHLCLLYINNPITLQQSADRGQDSSPSNEHARVELLESCARAIAGMSITLLTETAVCDVPHELFPGFFIAGIILYRQKLQKDPVIFQMMAASLDNCRIVLNQARESWDPGNWAMHIFDFLCSYCRRSKDRGPVQSADLPNNADGSNNNIQHDIPAIHNASETLLDDHQTGSFLNGDHSFEPGLENLMSGELTGGLDDYLFMADFLHPGAEEWIFPSFESNPS